jgi:TRAP transporter TAXI family solute receptor
MGSTDVGHKTRRFHMIKRAWFIGGLPLLALLVGGSAFALSWALPQQPARAASTVTVRISTGLPGVSFRPLGEQLVSAYAKVLPDVRFVVVETPGSVRNLENLQRGEADLGFALADVAYMAYNGRLSDNPRPFRNVRGIAVLHSSVVHFLAGARSRITSIPDLQGRRVGMGPPGSGAAVTSEVLLRAFHVMPAQVQEQALPFSQATDKLIRGDLDAAFIVSADPTDEVRRATAAGARLLDLRGIAVDELRAHYPFLRSGLIPAGMYAGHAQPIHTLSIDVLLLGRADLDQTLVHRLTAALFQVLPQLGAQLSFLRSMDPDRAPATPLPLHPGAALYYREKELSR